MFLDIENRLKELRHRYLGVSLNLQGSIRELSDIEEMLKQERDQFEVDIRNAVQNGNRDESAYKLLSLNRVRLELLLGLCVWDRRLHSLLSSDLSVMGTKAVDHVEEQTHQGEDENAMEFAGTEVPVESGDFMDDNSHEKSELVTSEEARDIPIEEIPIDGDIQGSGEQDALFASSSIDENTGGEKENKNESSPLDNVALSDVSVERSVSCPQLLTKDIGVSPLDVSNSQKGKCPPSLSSKLEHDKVWIWTPFSEIVHEYMTDLLRGNVPKFGCITSYALQTTAHGLIADEGSRLHIPLGTDGYILSDYESEFSSIIACALALLKDLSLAHGNLGEDIRKVKSFDAKTSENSHTLPRFLSLQSPHWLSTGSLDSDGHSLSSTHSEGPHVSGFDGLDLLGSFVSLSYDTHPEISMGPAKLPGKRKYSVVCLYASQFRQLRNRWCPSEEDYIASLSRCKNWDAKGGKSKSFFAKTLDDRFIIKEIKRTEFESFMEFAPNYFEYMNQCHDRQNQTCLAKILGIYQVVLRQTKNGKETKHDLLVMENLSFGRSFARSYDLKGALHARLTAGDGSGDVLLDQNFVNDMNESPLYVSRKSKRNLQRGVWNDTTFLYSINVMDYSLLVGVDTHRRELVCGIIDYLRQYTWDKQLETWVKSSLVPKNYRPTVISPKDYKTRFRKFIDTQFLSVPDNWCSQRSSKPCELCGVRDDKDTLSTRSQGLEELEDDTTHNKSPESPE